MQQTKPMYAVLFFCFLFFFFRHIYIRFAELHVKEADPAPGVHLVGDAVRDPSPAFAETQQPLRIVQGEAEILRRRLEARIRVAEPAKLQQRVRD